MILINFTNIEEIVLEKKDLVNKLPKRFLDHYHLWVMGKRHSLVNLLMKNAIFDALQLLTEPDCIKILTEYYQQDVVVESITHQTVKNIKLPISDFDEICKITDFTNLTTWRDADYLYISFWR